MDKNHGVSKMGTPDFAAGGKKLRMTLEGAEEEEELQHL